MPHFLIKVARNAVEEYVKTGKIIPVPEDYLEEYKRKRGVFVTIYRKTPKLLRGCIGFPYPSLPLIQALIEASVHACKDPRFKPISENELNEIEIELSILTEPELIEVNDSEEYLSKIKIGRDGLIIKNGMSSGLLLPQVPAEQGWDIEKFLENLCLKADLVRNVWKNENTRLYRFQAEIMRE